jgi:hypothetical protein
VQWSRVRPDKILDHILYQKEGALVGPDVPNCGTQAGVANDLLR